MIRILYKFFNKVSSRIIETVFINLLADFIGIMLIEFFSSYPQVVKFFTGYQFWLITGVFLSSLVIVNWLEKTGINSALLNWIETKYIRNDLATRIFEANPELNVKQFIRNFYLCTKDKLGFSEEEIREKLYATCKYLTTSDGKLLTTDKYFELIWANSHREEDSRLWITPNGFEQWVKEAKIRLV